MLLVIIIMIIIDIMIINIIITLIDGVAQGCIVSKGVQQRFYKRLSCHHCSHTMPTLIIIVTITAIISFPPR